MFALENHIKRRGNAGRRRLVIPGDALPLCSERGQPVQRAGIKVGKAEFGGDAVRDRSLTGSRRAVDRDDGNQLFHVIQPCCLPQALRAWLARSIFRMPSPSADSTSAVSSWMREALCLSPATIASAIGECDVAPHVRVRAGNAGEITEAGRGEVEQVCESALSSTAFI